MKINTLNTRQKSGFTLVELLVVMAIIASLAALSFTGFGGIIKKARKVSSMNHLTNIVGGIEGFYSDNSVYPTGNNNATVTVNATDSSEITDATGTLIQMLLAEEVVGAGANIQNKRKIKYLDGMQANDSGNDGINYSVAGYPFTDYEGISYQIIWDGNYDNQLDDPFGDTSPLRSRVVGIGQGTSESAVTNTMTGAEQAKAVKTW